jgi:hypothetical protein
LSHVFLVPQRTALLKTSRNDKFNLRTFHDFVWKNGNVPIALQRWEYLGVQENGPKP